MKITTNVTALLTPTFLACLAPDGVLIHFREKFDNAGKNIPPGKYAEATKRINKYNNKCAKLVREQYYPSVKSLVIALLKDWKLSQEADNARIAGVTFVSVGFDSIYQWVLPIIRPHVEGSNAYLHIANAMKPMVLKALKELENEQMIAVHRPRRKQWNSHSVYRWIGV